MVSSLYNLLHFKVDNYDDVLLYDTYLLKVKLFVTNVKFLEMKTRRSQESLCLTWNLSTD